MLQYLVVLFIWSFSSRLQSIQCMNPIDFNFIIYFIVGLLDTMSYTTKAYKTLGAEYFLISGVRHTDVFLYCWTCLQLAYKVCVWTALGLFVTVSPTHCLHSELFACFLLLTAVVIHVNSSRLRKWHITKYEKIPMEIPEDAI